jgi:hypothetical protein
VKAQTIDPPGLTVDGKSIADWTAAWWTRYWQAPPGAIDPNTGNVSANFNNNGPVFFGPTNTGSLNPDGSIPHTTIDFSVPAGQPILIPVFPFNDLESAGIDGNAPLAAREHAADVTVAGWLGAVDPTRLFASIDGVPVANLGSYLEQTGYFSAGLVQSGTIGASTGEPVGNDLFPNEAAGYWLMVEDLSGGEHTIDFGGYSAQFTPAANCCTNFPIGPSAPDITWNVDVIPEPASALLLLPGLIGALCCRRRRACGRWPHCARTP